MPRMDMGAITEPKGFELPNVIPDGQRDVT